jgi:hypothetical protein
LHNLQPADSDYWPAAETLDYPPLNLKRPSHAEDIYAELDESEQAEQYDSTYGTSRFDSPYEESF